MGCRSSRSRPPLGDQMPVSPTNSSLGICEHKVLACPPAPSSKPPSWKETEEAKRQYCVVAGVLRGKLHIPELCWMVVAYAERRWEWNDYWWIETSDIRIPARKRTEEHNPATLCMHPMDHEREMGLDRGMRLLMDKKRFLTLTEPIRSGTRIRFELSSFMRHFECGVGVLVCSRPPHSDYLPSYFGMSLLTGRWFLGHMSSEMMDENKAREQPPSPAPYQLRYDGPTWLTLELIGHSLIVSVSYLSLDQQMHQWTSTRAIWPTPSPHDTLFATVVVRDLFRQQSERQSPAPLSICVRSC